jgi:hypothetical protein
VELKLNGAHQLLAHADDMNLPKNNLNTTMKRTETLNDASKEVGLNGREKTNMCCCLITRMQEIS